MPPADHTGSESQCPAPSDRNVEAALRLQGVYDREGPWGVEQRFDEFFAPGATWHPAVSAFGEQVYSGREGLRRFITDMETHAKEFRQIVTEVRPAGDRHVLALGTMVIVGRGSGASFEGDYSNLWEFEDGRIVSVRAFLSHEEGVRAAADAESGAQGSDLDDA